MKSFSEFNEGNSKDLHHNGFKITFKMNKTFSEEDKIKFFSMLDLAAGYLKVKNCTIHITKSGDSDASGRTNHCNVRYDKNIEKMVETLAHELTHIKQHLVGDFVDSDEPFDYDHGVWKGKRAKIYTSGVKYHHSPWEVEARDIARKLIGLWKRFNK